MGYAIDFMKILPSRGPFPVGHNVERLYNDESMYLVFYSLQEFTEDLTHVGSYITTARGRHIRRTTSLPRERSLFTTILHYQMKYSTTSQT